MMIYKNLIREIHFNTNIPTEIVKKVVDELQEVVFLKLTLNEPVHLNKLGSFNSKLIKPREVKFNNKTIMSAPKKTIFFKIKDSVKNQLTEAAEATGEFL